MAYQIGTHYDYIIIDRLVWMGRNLDVDTYQNGEPIPNTTTGWASLTTGAWRYYNDDIGIGKIYGKLYNRYAVDDVRGLAPVGWRVATQSDWNNLIDNLGEASIAGGKLKAEGFTYWNSPNTGATNSSRFTALPAGNIASSTGNSTGLGQTAAFWLPTAGTTVGNRILLSNTDNGVDTSTAAAANGFSIRCVRDLY
jgi:uncharacterized protein (TIGR02145 family)